MNNAERWLQIGVLSIPTDLEVKLHLLTKEQVLAGGPYFLIVCRDWLAGGANTAAVNLVLDEMSGFSRGDTFNVLRQADLDEFPLDPNFESMAHPDVLARMGDGCATVIWRSGAWEWTVKGFGCDNDARLTFGGLFTLEEKLDNNLYLQRQLGLFTTFGFLKFVEDLNVQLAK